MQFGSAAMRTHCCAHEAWAGVLVEFTKLEVTAETNVQANTVANARG